MTSHGDHVTDDIQQAKKLSAFIPVSEDQLADGVSFWANMRAASKRFDAMTPAEQAEWRRARQERIDAELAEKRARHAALVESLDGVVREIAEWHAPDEYGHCGVCCDRDGDDEPWPCSTVAIILDA